MLVKIITDENLTSFQLDLSKTGHVFLTVSGEDQNFLMKTFSRPIASCGGAHQVEDSSLEALPTRAHFSCIWHVCFFSGADKRKSLCTPFTWNTRQIGFRNAVRFDATDAVPRDHVMLQFAHARSKIEWSRAEVPSQGNHILDPEPLVCWLCA